MDWSLVRIGRWSKREAGGEAPDPLYSFASGHHNGSIYVIGGMRGSAPYGPTNDVFALSLGDMRWRRVGISVR